MRRWELGAREEIRMLVARYNGCGDQGKIGELSELFAPDGTLEIHGADGHVGPAAIEAFLSSVAADNTVEGTYWRHFVATHNVEVTDRRSATGTAYFGVLDPGGLNHWGRYRDRYIRNAAGQWRFAHRLVRTDGSTQRAGSGGPVQPGR